MQKVCLEAHANIVSDAVARGAGECLRYTFAAMAKAEESGARFQAASDQSLIVYFDAPEEKNRSKDRPLQTRIQANEKVRKLLRLLEQEPVEGVRNLHPAYASLLVKFDGLRLRHKELETKLKKFVARLDEAALSKARVVEIPICYSGEFGPDLAEVAQLHGLTEDKVIELHTATEYLVYFLGFVPGFAYLGDLPETLVTPRLAAPRKSVPAGSVGIAGNQTGVYPFSTPGGWRLLGRTPVKLFHADHKELSLLAIGDRVRFRAISTEQFAEFAR